MLEERLAHFTEQENDLIERLTKWEMPSADCDPVKSLLRVDSLKEIVLDYTKLESSREPFSNLLGNILREKFIVFELKDFTEDQSERIIGVLVRYVMFDCRVAFLEPNDWGVSREILRCVFKSPLESNCLTFFSDSCLVKLEDIFFELDGQHRLPNPTQTLENIMEFLSCRVLLYDDKKVLSYLNFTGVGFHSHICIENGLLSLFNSIMDQEVACCDTPYMIDSDEYEDYQNDHTNFFDAVKPTLSKSAIIAIKRALALCENIKDLEHRDVRYLITRLRSHLDEYRCKDPEFVERANHFFDRVFENTLLIHDSPLGPLTKTLPQWRSIVCLKEIPAVQKRELGQFICSQCRELLTWDYILEQMRRLWEGKSRNDTNNWISASSCRDPKEKEEKHQFFAAGHRNQVFSFCSTGSQLNIYTYDPHTGKIRMAERVGFQKHFSSAVTANRSSCFRIYPRYICIFFRQLSMTTVLFFCTKTHRVLISRIFSVDQDCAILCNVANLHSILFLYQSGRERCWKLFSLLDCKASACEAAFNMKFCHSIINCEEKAWFYCGEEGSWFIRKNDLSVLEHVRSAELKKLESRRALHAAFILRPGVICLVSTTRRKYAREIFLISFQKGSSNVVVCSERISTLYKRIREEDSIGMMAEEVPISDFFFQIRQGQKAGTVEMISISRK